MLSIVSDKHFAIYYEQVLPKENRSSAQEMHTAAFIFKFYILQ